MAQRSRLRFGVLTYPEHVTYREISQTLDDIDDAGCDAAFIFDHFVPFTGNANGPCFEGWMLLSALAAQTKQVRVGVLVTGNTYLGPKQLTAQAACGYEQLVPLSNPNGLWDNLPLLLLPSAPYRRTHTERPKL